MSDQLFDDLDLDFDAAERKVAERQDAQVANELAELESVDADDCASGACKI